MRVNLKLFLTLLSLIIPALVFADTPIVTYTKTVQVTPVVDTNAYTAGDCVGGKLTFPDIVRPIVYSGEVRSVTVTDIGADQAGLNLVLFNADPSSSTFTNNAACAIADADLSKVVCVVPITTHYVFADNGASTAVYVGCAFQLDNATTLYGVLVATGTPTLDSASALTVKLSVRQD